jgi:hypothetical protein
VLFEGALEGARLKGALKTTTGARAMKRRSPMRASAGCRRAGPGRRRRGGSGRG